MNNTCRGENQKVLRKGATVMAAAGVAALLLAACSSSPAPASKSSSTGPVILGLASPLTGGDPTEGKTEVAAVNDAAKYVNSHGGIDGRPLKVVVRDTGLTPTGAVTSLDSLASAGAAAVLGEFTSTDTAAACTAAMQQHEVVLGPASAAQGLTHGKTYCFRDEYQVSQSTGAMFAIAKSEGWKSIAVATDTTDFGIAENKSWVSLASHYGFHIAANVTWTAPASSLTSQVLTIAHSGANAIFVGAALGPDATLLAKTLVQEGVNLPLFGPGGINDPGVPQAAASSYDHLPLVANLTSYDSQVPQQTALFAKVQQQTGIPQGGGDMPRYWEGVLILAAGLRKSHGVGGIALVDALQSLGRFSTVPWAGGPGSYVHYTAVHHSGLFGPHLFTVYKWDKSTNAFVVSSRFTSLANTSGVTQG